MSYIKLSTFEYPLFEGDIRLEHPDIPESLTGDDFPCPPTYIRVYPSDPIEYDHMTQALYELDPQPIDGKWYIQWGIRELTLQEKINVAKKELTEENVTLKREMKIAELSLQNPTISDAKKVYWQQYLDEATAYINSYPREGLMPKIPYQAYVPEASPGDSLPERPSSGSSE